MNVKEIAKKFANILDYDIRKLHGAGCLRKSLSESFSLLYNLGFRPKTVVDVGVANGTSELYSAFPHSYFLLIEPLQEFEPKLKSILRRYQGSHVIAAVGQSCKKKSLLTFIQIIWRHHLFIKRQWELRQMDIK